MADYGKNLPEENNVTISTAVAIDRDKKSHHAVRWAIGNLRLKEKMIVLVHVISQHGQDEGRLTTQLEIQQLFLPYRGLCARKGVRTKEVVLHDTDVAVALSEFISANSIKNIVFGAAKRFALTRAFQNADVATSLGKFAPDFCSVYVVSKGKSHKIKREESLRSAASDLSSIDDNEYQQTIPTEKPIGSGAPSSPHSMNSDESTLPESVYNSFESMDSRCNSLESFSDDDSGMQIQPSVYFPDRTAENWPHYPLESSDHSESYASDISYELLDEPRISDTSRCSTASSIAVEMEDELKRMKLELKLITEKYNAACQEAVIAREKVRDIVHRSSDESPRSKQVKKTEEAALAIVETEKQKCRAAIELAQKAQRMAEMESEKRKQAEWRFKIEAKEKQQMLGFLARLLIRYRRYSIEEIEAATNHFSDSDKIGEGSYGPVYKASMDHTPVAIKVLRSNISEGLKQFQQEVEVLSRMRHPNMVILLGACPDYGCLVYEYMENGSLEDRLFCKDGTPPLPWPTRFCIAAEIATALNFLHQTRPEPLVHRDLKPANILLDRNYVSKISDVGLSRLVPPSVADGITQYLMTTAAGTFCYIDPEYQQTGLLGTKSDIYSLGIILLQLITARDPMGLTHQVKVAIESGRFAEVLDPAVKDWPMEETLCFAKIALKCSELSRKDRPSLDSVILPELERLREVGARIKAGRRRLHRYSYSRGLSFPESSSSSFQEISHCYGT